MFRPFHDALIEDALDNAEQAITDRVARPGIWSRHVRLPRAALEQATDTIKARTELGPIPSRPTLDEGFTTLHGDTGMIAEGAVAWRVRPI